MLPGFKVSKCAILADPREPAKRAAITEALALFLPELERSGITCCTYITEIPDWEELARNTDLFIVLGGDGTMIHFAGKLSHHKIPFYGLNYGNVGFMMNNPKAGLARHARRIRRGSFAMWEFPVLKVHATDMQGNIHQGIGLNDIYLQRMTPQSCKVNITIDDIALNINPILCDGLIVATPLGSTAYNFNTNGSMVAINTPAITLTPIAAHRSCPVACMMLSLETRIRFDILEPEKRRVQVVSDGQSHGGLTSAEIHVSPQMVRLCFDPENSKNLPMRFINKACG